MSLHIYSVFDPEFAAYGRVVDGYDYTELLDTLKKVSPCPGDAVIYVPGDDTLEALAVKTVLQNNCYGGMPIQIGYCNGTNTKLNCLEFHRDSEINIPAGNDAILLLAKMDDIVDNKLDTAKVKAFKCPAGTAVEVYATTLHYAPCSAKKDEGFRVIIVLPKGTNYPLSRTHEGGEDRLLFATNKWLIGHAQGGLPEGAFIGLKGENLSV